MPSPIDFPICAFFDLSISKYKEIEYEEIEYEKPSVLKKKILEIEDKISKGLKDLDI